VNEFLEQFLIECRELVQQATEDLLTLEKSPDGKDAIDSVFRAFHTLKGGAGIVEFSAMERALHAAEDVLSAVRSGDRPVTAELIGDCLTCLDQVVQWLDTIETDGGIPTAPDAAADTLVARFKQIDIAEPAPEIVQGPPGWLDEFLARHPEQRRRARVALRYTPDAGCFFRGEDPLALIAGLPDILALEVTPKRPWPSLEELDPFDCNLIITALTAAAPNVLREVSGQVEIWPLIPPPPDGDSVFSPEAVAVLEEQVLLAADDEPEGFLGRLGSAAQVAANVLRQSGRQGATITLQEAIDRSQRERDPAAFINAVRSLLDRPIEPPVPNEDEDPAPRTIAVRALRVDVERLDALVKLTGELTVAKNALGHTARLAQDGADPESLAQTLKDQHALLDRLVGELQRSVIGMRVLPLRHVFQRFPRLMRDMARDLGKSARLLTEGDTTEADKATVETLFEPLLHVLRNALDHGIEPEAERRSAGKPPTALIRMRAEREGEHVIVEVTDDGRGIDTAKVRQVAARRGIASAEALTDMTNEAVAELIFAPGFSTAATVTGVSGRGVGMDAVRSAVARMGGDVSVTSHPGEGTSVRFKLPFTLMMLRVMTVDAGGQVFGIPIAAVIETIRLPRDRISRLGAAEAFVLRDRTVPLVRLTDVLGVPAGRDTASPEANIVVIVVGGQTGALEVDGFGERMDVMLKPMEGLLAGMNGLAGTTLLGDGRVLVVLDLQELLR
jgi:two-component system chemotaxis sensor kinase CheA